jgi:uncharacterized protein (TIGR03067 family)
MVRLTGFVLAVALVFSVSDTAVGQVIPALEGQWKVVNGQMHGQVVPASATNSMTLTISGGTFKGESAGLMSSGSLAVDPSTPTMLKFSITTGADLGRTLNAMYRVDGTTLIIVFSETGEFPTSFESTAANKYLVLNYQQIGVGNVAPASGGDGRAGMTNQVVD